MHNALAGFRILNNVNKIFTNRKTKMTKRKSKKDQLPSNEDINSKKDEAMKIFQEVIDGNRTVKAGKETLTDKLNLIRDQLMMFKDKAITYGAMKQLVEDAFDLKVSEQTLRQYCQNTLGFEKRRKTGNSDAPKKLEATKTQNKKDNENTKTKGTSSLKAQHNFD